MPEVGGKRGGKIGGRELWSPPAKEKDPQSGHAQIFDIKQLKADAAREALEDELAETAPQTAARLEAARKVDADLREKAAAGPGPEAVASPEVVAQPEVIEQLSPEALAAREKEWDVIIQKLEDAGAFDTKGRWTSIPPGTTREQVRHAEDLRAKRKTEASKVEKPAEVNEPAAITENLETDNFKPEIEIGTKFEMEINQELKNVTYQGDDADGKAIMVTEKGARMLNKGLQAVMDLGEIYPNEFFVAVDKDSLKEKKAAV